MRRFVVVAVLAVLLVPALAIAVSAPEVSSGLRISRLYWTTEQVGRSSSTRYTLNCVVTNVSKQSFVKVRGEGSLMNRSDNSKFQTLTAETINLAPGDTWKWTAAQIVLGRGQSASAYYGRVDRVIGSYAN